MKKLMIAGIFALGSTLSFAVNGEKDFMKLETVAVTENAQAENTNGPIGPIEFTHRYNVKIYDYSNGITHDALILDQTFECMTSKEFSYLMFVYNETYKLSAPNPNLIQIFTTDLGICLGGPIEL